MNSIEIIERCDRCNAAAYMVAENENLSLFFCLHHAREHNESLERQGWEVTYDFKAIEQILPNHYTGEPVSN